MNLLVESNTDTYSIVYLAFMYEKIMSYSVDFNSVTFYEIGVIDIFNITNFISNFPD